MGKSSFEFRQFRISQDQCAMKVSTDACIQGAWTPATGNAILDIGTGTGLLALMLAQRAPQATIDALEFDIQAVLQARQNVEASPFAAQIRVHETDAKAWHADRHYDLILCNPPFFSNSLKGPDSQRNRARHNDTLNQDDLAEMLSRFLHIKGIASVLLPASEAGNWEKAMGRHSLHVRQILHIKPFADKVPNRVIYLCGREQVSQIIQHELIIYTEPGKYTTGFTELLRPYYLYL
jgi:tRNA1Val (adenine37-N6)-methyltransferase